jgi:hypothetical protein
MTFFFVPSCGTACSGHVTVPHKAAKVRASVRAFEDHPGGSKVRFLNPSELTCVCRAPDQFMGCARLDRDKKRGTTINADTIHSDRNATADVITMSARASGADAFDAAEDPAKGTGNQRLIGGWNGPTAIQHIARTGLLCGSCGHRHCKWRPAQRPA